MQHDSAISPTLPRDLGDGLLLRRAVPADTEALVELNSTVLVDPSGPCPDEGEANWTRDLMRGDHPTVTHEDYTVVEDLKTGALVSAMVLISQTWAYEGVLFGVGRPEQVVTRPEYRGRGLVRAQIEALHARSAGKGELVHAITGIPYFYRQFGYEMAVALGGGREASTANIPRLEAGAVEPFSFRLAAAADAEWVAALDAQAGQRGLLSCVRDETLWRYEIAGKSEKNWTRLEMRVIETSTGDVLGYIGHESRMMSNRLGVAVAEVKPGVSWLRIAPSLFRYIWAAGESLAARDAKQMHAIVFLLGTEHPLYQVAPKRLSDIWRPYAWYLRVADLPAFLRRIAPVLEERLASSAVVGYTGSLKLSFYRSGLLIAFVDGRLTGADPWRPSHEDQGAAAFPGLSFLQLLFGYRSLSELHDSFPDCWTETDEAQAVLESLFPKKPSNIFWPVA